MANRVKNNPRVIPAGKVQLNFNAVAENAIKLKQVALNEQVSSAEILNLALSRFLDAYESKNGKLKTSIKPKGEGLKHL